MVSRTVLYICFSFLLVIGNSCKNESEITQQLNLADELMNTRPDSAYTLLKQIDSKQLSGKEEKAWHALLLSQALDKNCIDISSDSIVKIAKNYYSARKDTPEWGKTCYYMGRIAQNSGNIEEAVKYYLEAISSLKNSNHADVMGLAYSAVGVIFYNQRVFNKALEYYRKAISYFQSDSIYQKNLAINYEKLGLAYRMLKEKDSTTLYYNKSLLISKQIKDTTGLSRVSTLIAYTYTNKQDAINYIKDAHRDFNLTYTLGDYALLTHSYQQLNNLDSAKKYAQLMLVQKTLSLAATPGVYKILLLVAQKEKNMEAALEYALKICEVKDTLHKQWVENMAAEYEQKYNAAIYQHKLKNSEQKRIIIIRISLLIITILLISSAFVIYIRKKKALQIIDAQKLQIEEDISKILQSQNEILIKDKEIRRNKAIKENIDSYNKYAEDLKSNMQDQITLYKEILNISWLYEEHEAKKLSFIKTFFSSKSHEIQKLYTNLPSVINICHFGLCDYLREKLDLDTEEIEIISMILLNFTADNICTVKGIKQNTFYNKRANIRKKLGLADKEIDLIQYLNGIAESLKTA
ncbi:MAG: hypothetical protein RR555_10025 [Bacteroidales bacterium]